MKSLRAGCVSVCWLFLRADVLGGGNTFGHIPTVYLLQNAKTKTEGALGDLSALLSLIDMQYLASLNGVAYHKKEACQS